MGLIQIVLLAIVQGLTEFLPVSSSGHVVIVAYLLNPTGLPETYDVVEVNIVLHVGTLLSVLVFYWQQVRELFGEDRRTISLLVLGTIPAAILGLLLSIYAKPWLKDPFVGKGGNAGRCWRGCRRACPPPGSSWRG